MTRRLSIGAGLMLLVLAGCGAAGDDSGGDAAAPAPAEERDAVPPDQDAEQGGDEAGGIAGGTLVDTRSIIYTGSITVRVDNVDQAAEAAAALAQRYQGFVGGDQRSASNGTHAQAYLTLRIPSESFAAAVADLAELGEEESRQIQTQDVTEEVVDLETRIATAEASVERTRDLMERAESIDDIVRVESELSEREAALASLQARQRELADLTALSTINIELFAREAEPEEEPEETGFLAGLGSGWRGLTATVEVALTVLGVLLPWLLVLAVPAAAGWWLVRRRRPAPADQPPSAP
jgi:hypothetical protein